MLIRKIPFDTQEKMSTSEFTEFFDKHRVKLLAELVKDYGNIGDMYLRSIEEVAFKTNNQDQLEMSTYYYYWERRIFNAITKMMIRALAANKALWGRHKDKPLITMKASFDNNEMSYSPPVEELRTQLDKFNRNILLASQSFGRWWDGFCKIFEA